MSDQVTALRRYDLPLAPDESQNLSVDEVRVLWSFVHGDIMDTQTRARLHADWGMCSRHAWGYSSTEIELWESGAGRRGGHQPFDVSILYAYLLERMIAELSTNHHRRRMKTLAGQGTCLVCDDVRDGTPSGILVTHAGFDPDSLAAEANRFAFTRSWFQDTAAHWQPHACPDCWGRASGEVAPTSLPCRLHLIASGDVDNETRDQTVTQLAELHTMLLALTESMTQSGDASTAAIDASWIRTLGWFHGWSFPLIMQRSRDEGG